MQSKEKDRKVIIQEDFEIIRKILDGDTEQFRFLQKRYKGQITSLIRRMIKNEDDVEDLVQETFIKSYNALATFQFGYTFSSWIYRIASNACIDFLRKRRFNTFSIDQPLSNSDDEGTYEIEDKSYMPDADIYSNEKKNIIDQAISELPEQYQEIIKLRHIEEMDYNEIAIKLDMPLGTVKAHLFRSRKLLHEKLSKHYHLFKG